MISELFWGGQRFGTLNILICLKGEKKFIALLFFISITTIGYSQTTIWEEKFNTYADGATVGTGNRWTITTTPDVNGADPDDYFKVMNNQMELHDSNWNEQVFTTEAIDISAYSDISLRVELTEEGIQESNDYINVYYVLDIGSGFGVEIPFFVNGLNADDFDAKTAYQSGLVGLQIKIIIRLKNSADLEYYRVDDILIQSEEPGFYDSDGDGLFDNVDIDDDNDGIIDVNEELSCLSSAISNLVNTVVFSDNSLTEVRCDTDNDGIANSLDLDSDDDGIPDVIESGLGNLNSGAGFIDASTSNWKDNNADGLHDDVSLVFVALDSDSDLTPNYLDLDSDNDTLFDIDESQAGNSNKTPNFENGDGDINGDGTGDFPESEAFRLKDSNGDGITELYGDGIQDGFEHFNGTFGNTGQVDPLDSDNDGIPDYLDLTSDGASFDISNTFYASFDSNNDGVIDNTTDIEGDGIADLFDTDELVFGSPRDLNRSLYIHFDGRNDYAQDENILNNVTEFSIMAWINIDTSFSNTGIIIGQDNFNLKLNNSKKITAAVNGISITYGTSLNTNQWIHVAIIFDGNSTSLKLYVNGEEVASSNLAPSSIGSDTSLFTIAKKASANTNYYYGGIEEVRVFDIALTELQLQKMIYQKIGDNGSILGEIIPFDIDVPWSNLVRYYRMDTFKDDIIDDRAQTESTIDQYSNSYSAKCYNIKNIKIETAPMPFITEAVASNLDLGIAVSQNNDVRGDDVEEIDWSITHIKHDVDLDVNHSDMGLIVDSGVTVNLNNDTYLNNQWYLKLDGLIDLNGESQLIQTANSYLATNSSGFIERDQQGTANSFTYNYWSAPVSQINTAENNKEFYLKAILLDGTIPNATIRNINFGTSADPYFSDGSLSGQIKITSYWLYRFVNYQTNDYVNWEWIGSGNESGSKKLKVTEGYTMKGTSGLSTIADTQNYVFFGKPNNAPVTSGSLGGDLVHTNFDGNFDSNGNPKISLAGNPFPSAIDAHKFIDDNANSIDGQLYLWDHWGGGSHQWLLYQGGYAIRNKAGGIAATSHPDVSQAGNGSKAPGQYIPVGQGFYVIQKNTYDSGTESYSNPGNGDVVFKNSQRIFKTEANVSESVFTKISESKLSSIYKKTSDSVQRIRIGFKSSDGFFRPIMIAFLNGATDELDYGYDAFAGDFLPKDALFFQDNRYLVIQSFGRFEVEREIPIAVFIDEEGAGGIQRFSLESIENFDQKIEVYIKDNRSGETQEITNSTFEVDLEPGEYKDRFSLVFQSGLLAISEFSKIEEGVNVFMNNANKKIVIQKISELDFVQVSLFNSIGQVLKTWNTGLDDRNISLPIEVSSGVYIVRLKTKQGLFSKKILIE